MAHTPHKTSNGGGISPSIFRKLYGIVHHNHHNKRNNHIKLVVLGYHNVGKTALIIRWMTDQFYNNYVPEQEQTYNHTVVMGGKKVHFDIMDTKGKNTALISHADAILLVFSVTDAQSFTHLEQLLVKVRDLTFSRTPLLMVANKCDKGNTARQVTRDVYMKLAEDNNLRCFEVSAATPRLKLDVVFEEVYYQVHVCKTRTRTFSNPNSANLERRQIRLGSIQRQLSVSMEEGMFRERLGADAADVREEKKKKKKKRFSLAALID